MGGNVDGQGHTCVHATEAAVFQLYLLLKCGADVGRRVKRPLGRTSFSHFHCVCSGPTVA